MKILLFGGTGFVGRKLKEALIARKHEVFVRDLRKDKNWTSEISKVDAVVNLGGTPLFNKRWNYDYKTSIYDSRVEGNQAIAAALDKYLSANPSARKTFVTASAIGFYGNTGDEILDESASQGTDFLAQVCSEWEQAAFKLSQHSQVRRLAFRIGIVMGPEGGALEKMILPFQFFVGGPIGNGLQWTSWVHLEDVVGAFVWALENEKAQGIYNLTSPEPLRNKDFSRELGAALDRPSWLPVPRLALRVVVGEAASVLSGGQRVVPQKLLNEGYHFKYTSLKNAFHDIFVKADKFRLQKDSTSET